MDKDREPNRRDIVTADVNFGQNCLLKVSSEVSQLILLVIDSQSPHTWRIGKRLAVAEILVDKKDQSVELTVKYQRKRPITKEVSASSLQTIELIKEFLPSNEFRAVQTIELIEAYGVPVLVVHDEEQKKIFISSLFADLLKLPHDAPHTRWTRRCVEDLHIKLKISSQLSSDVIDFIERVKNNLPTFRSLEESHVFWVELIINSLQECGVSQQTIDLITENDPLLWDLHWEISQTFYGSIATELNGDNRKWKNLQLSRPKRELKRGEISQAVKEYYEERKVSFFQMQETLQIPTKKRISDSAFQIPLKSLYSQDKSQLIYEDQSGFQVAVNMGPNRISVRVWGVSEENEENETTIHEFFIFQKRYIPVDSRSPNGIQDYFQISPTEFVSYVGDDFAVTADHTIYVVSKTIHGARCITISLGKIFSLGKINSGENYITVEGDNFDIEQTLDWLWQLEEEERNSSNTSTFEIIAGQEAQRFALAQVNKGIKESYRDVFYTHLELIEVFSEKEYDILAKTSVTSLFLDKVFEHSERVVFSQLLAKEYAGTLTEKNDIQRLKDFKAKFRQIAYRMYLIAGGFESMKNVGEDDLWNFISLTYFGKVYFTASLIFYMSMTKEIQKTEIDRLEKMDRSFFKRRIGPSITELFEHINNIRTQILDDLAKTRESEKAKRKNALPRKNRN